MPTLGNLRKRVAGISPAEFDDLALELFHYQAETNPVYSKFIGHLGFNLESITHLSQIPFMPVEFFKYHRVLCDGISANTVYSSSGTTNQVPSLHYVSDNDFYLDHAVRIFESFYGSLENYHILGLLPGYLEREGSSLIAMVRHFISRAGDEHSGFYLYDHAALREKISFLAGHSSRKLLLLGVSFALLDLAEEGHFPVTDKLIVMETGGMKGRRKEMLREELHAVLCNAFSVDQIHSEYGMTEALSQAYSMGQGLFHMPNSMQIRLRDPYDPLDLSNSVKRGAVNLVDLANYHSCAFLQLGDIAERTPEGLFRILGRLDNSDVRGCNLMVQQPF
ncbi:MAG: acyl transferase [Cyclobacteriaceae bacterium]